MANQFDDEHLTDEMSRRKRIREDPEELEIIGNPITVAPAEYRMDILSQMRLVTVDHAHTKHFFDMNLHDILSIELKDYPLERMEPKEIKTLFFKCNTDVDRGIKILSKEYGHSHSTIRSVLVEHGVSLIENHFHTQLLEFETIESRSGTGGIYEGILHCKYDDIRNMFEPNAEKHLLVENLVQHGKPVTLRNVYFNAVERIAGIFNVSPATIIRSAMICSLTTDDTIEKKDPMLYEYCMNSYGSFELYLWTRLTVAKMLEQHAIPDLDKNTNAQEAYLKKRYRHPLL